MIILFLLFIPNLLYFFYSKDLNVLLISFFINVFLISILKSSKRLILLFPFYFLTPFVLYYIYKYNTSVSEQILSVVFETNYQEAIQYIGIGFFNFLVLLLFWGSFTFYISYLNFKKPLIWTHRSRLWVLFLGSIFLICSSFFSLMFETENNTFTKDLNKTYPFGLFFAFENFIIEQNKINKAFKVNESFKFGILSKDNSNESQTYILVIGETGRRNNWSLNGYSRDTNRLLSKQKNLANFSNMISITTATRSSVPMIITRKPVSKINNYDFPEKSIISAFKEAGYSTYWISTQQKFGAFDTSTSVFSKEADHILFLNKTNYTEKGEKDGVILPVLNDILNNNERKRFIVIHTLGSHYDYSYRYPESFNIYRPSLSDISNYSLQNSNVKEELVNSYDNSLLYTDYFLNQIIEVLKKKNETSSFLLYSSDHGEDIFDNGCNKSGHGNDTKYTYEIASFAWYSDLYEHKNPEKIKWLLKNKNRKINHTSIFPTLIDAANFMIPNDQLDRSVLKNFQNYNRIVSNGVDFDKVTPKGICKEIK